MKSMLRHWVYPSFICMFMCTLYFLPQLNGGTRRFYSFTHSLSNYPHYSDLLNKTLSARNYSWYREYSLSETHVQPCPKAKKWIYIYTQGRSGSTMLGRLLRSSNTQCHCDKQVNDPKHYYLFEPLHAFPDNLNVSQVNSIYQHITSCKVSPIYPQLKADSMVSKLFAFTPLPCPFSFKDMEVDPSSFGCIFINSRQLDVMCSKACVRVIKDIRLKNFQEEEQATILSNLLTSNENLQIIYLSRDPRGIYNSMNNTRVFHAEFKSICVSSNRASRIVANLSKIFGSNRIFEVTYESVASEPLATIFDLFVSKLHISFSIETVNWIVENMLRIDKNSHSSAASSYTTNERNALAEAFKWKTNSGDELQKQFENEPHCRSLLSPKQKTLG